MRKWRDSPFATKLAVSYSILILVFFSVGTYTIRGLYNYKKEFLNASEDYIPLVENTNKIERLTNQVMQFLWEFTVLGDEEYYDLGKSTLSELNQSLEETHSIISGSSELSVLNSELLRITNWTKELELIIDETKKVQTQLGKNQGVLNKIFEDFSGEATRFLIKGENVLRNELSREQTEADYLYNRHRKNRIINLIVDKGNKNMISSFEAIAMENPDLLTPTFQEFVYINNLLEIIDSLSVEDYEFEGVAQFRSYFSSFRSEVYSLKTNLIKSRELSVRRGEIANVVIFEAREMGRNGINLAGQTLNENYQMFNRSVPIYFVGLLLALIMAVLFSILITRSITIPISKSVQFAEEIASGNLDASVDLNQGDEVGILARALKNMGVELQSIMKELQQAERKMLSISIKAEEKERKRIAEDLHDSLGPQLSIIKLYTDALKDSAMSEERRQYMIGSSIELIMEAIFQVKNISYNLLPSLLSDFGLDMAIRSFCDKIIEVSEIEINYTSIDYPSDFNRHTETMLFRVVKELVNNTIKHANAKRIDILMYIEEENLIINYRDDGSGFEIQSDHGEESRGLANINSRIYHISGKINYKSELGKGTEVRISVNTQNLYKDQDSLNV